MDEIIVALVVLSSPFVIAFLWIFLEDLLEKYEFERFLYGETED